MIVLEVSYWTRFSRIVVGCDSALRTVTLNLKYSFYYTYSKLYFTFTFRTVLLQRGFSAISEVPNQKTGAVQYEFLI